MTNRMGRRSMLGGIALLPLGARVVSAAPAAEPITPALIEAAKKEGKVSYYNAMDLSVVEPMAKACSAGSRRRWRARSIAPTW
jgi:iron(III) transport system substrate-binding protein